MSAKPEQAQAPPIVADGGGAQQTHQMQHQTHPPNNYHQGQVIYQQPYGPMQHYQQQAPPVWNQPPQAAIHYVQYPPPQQQEGFHDPKNQGYQDSYGTMHYPQPMANGEMMIRGPPPPPHQTAYVSQQYVSSQQWYPPAQQNQGQFIPTYATTFNVANDPSYHPNHPMNRPGAARQEEYQGGNDGEVAGYMQFVPFVPPMGAMESQAHASASYTANWVSSTSSIPPEMKDEPESDNISQYESQRPSSHLNGDWTDHEDYMSPSTMQQSFTVPPPPRPMPYGGEKDKSTSQSTTKTSKSAKGERSEEKRELTFDERLEKARMQKTRAENKGANGESSGNFSTHQHGSATSPSTRSYGMRLPREYPRNEGGYNNNSHRGRGGHYKEVFHHNGEGEQFPPPHHPPPQQYFQNPFNNAVQERDRSKRDNYSANRYDNNIHNNTHQPRNPQDGNRPSNYRGRGGAPRGAFRGGYQGNPPPPFPYGQCPNNAPDHGVRPNMSNMTNKLQNTHISNMLPPPGMPPGGPLMPMPYGHYLSRQPPIAQDVKFHNTWLDASNCPVSLAAMMAMDTRFGRGGFAPTTNYRGRGGRGGGYANRGGFRGGYSSPRYMGRAAEPVVQKAPEEVAEQQQEPTAQPENESGQKTTDGESPVDQQQEENVEKKLDEKPSVDLKLEEEVEVDTENKENGKSEDKDQVEAEVEVETKKESTLDKTPDAIPELVISEPTENANTDNEVEKVVEEVADVKDDKKEAESS